MAVTSDSFDATELQYTIPEIWPGIMLEDVFPKAVFTAWFTNLSDLYEGGGDIINIPDLYSNDFTVQTQSTEAAEVTTDAPAQDNQQLTVDTHKYIAFVMGDKTAKQVARKYNLMEAYARKCKGQLMNEVEAAIAALWSDFSTNTVGDTGTIVTDQEIRSAIGKLDVSTEGQLDQVAGFFHPTIFWNQLAGITKYYDNSISEARLIKTGGMFQKDSMRALAGFIYDIPIFKSTNVVGALQTYRNFFAHREAIVWGQLPIGGEVFRDGTSTPLTIRTQSSYELRNLGTLVVVDTIYGVKTVREAFGCLVNANTTDIAS